jgi:hypothetical protein
MAYFLPLPLVHHRAFLFRGFGVSRQAGAATVMPSFQLGTQIGDVEVSNLSQEHRSIAQMSLPFSQVSRSVCAS